MSDIESWSTTDNASANQQVPPDGWPEGMSRTFVNDSARANMGAIRRFYNASEFVNLYQEPLRAVSKATDTQIRIAAVNVVSDFPTNRRVQVTDGTTTVSGFVTTAVFSSPDTVVTLLLDSGVVPTGTNKVLVHSGKTLGKLAFRSVIAGDQLFDVTAYGAVGNNTADDAAAIQAAIDACEAAGGGTVYFPQGQYRVNTGLTVTIGGIRLAGEGPGISVLRSGSATAYIVTIGDNITEITGVEVTGLGFTARAGISATAGGAIFLQKAPRTRLFNLSIFGTTEIVALPVPLRNGIDMNGVTGGNVQLYFNDIFLQGCIDDGIRLQNASGTFSDLRVTGNGRDGILLDTCDFIQMDSVSVSGTSLTRYGFHFASTLTPVSPVTGGQHDCTFTNCQSLVTGDHCWNILNCSLSTFSGCMAQFAQNNPEKDGFHLVNIADVHFSGCQAIDNDRHGFSLDGCTRVSVQSSIASRSSDGDPAGAGIRLNNCNGCLVASNNVSENPSGASQKYGVLVEGTSGSVNPNFIVANLARDNQTKNFEDTSSGINLWRDNRSPDVAPTVVAAAATAIPNLADQIVTVTGNTTITSFTGFTHPAKVFTAVFTGTLTLTHNLTPGVGIKLAGAVSAAITPGSVMSFVFETTGAVYREVSRMIAS